MSYPNQKKIYIKKPKYKGSKEPFLQVGIEAWQNAFKKYEKKPTVFAMYLYLASNADGHEKWLSSKAVEEAIGISRSSYYRALKTLQEDGYIYEASSGALYFVTKPKEGLRKAIQNWDSNESSERQRDVKDETAESHTWNKSESRVNREIYNINTINKIDKKDNGRSLSELKKIISPTGQYIGKMKWLEEEVPDLWEMHRADRVQAIYSHTEFNEEEAHLIAYSVLDEHKRRKAITLSDLNALDDEW